MSNLKDPLGQAILEFSKTGSAENITVQSDICDDDILPIEYLFRTWDEMPELEQKALDLCKGKVLEVGAGAGCHSKYLISKNIDTLSIDTSEGVSKYLSSQDIPNLNTPFLDLKNNSFDTILILMNGLGLSGTLANLPAFLEHAKSLLRSHGSIIADSSDIRYLYEDDEGGTWVNLNSKYPGEMNFKMNFKDHESDWFPWLYVDFDTLRNSADQVGLKATKIFENENFHYLVKLELL